MKLLYIHGLGSDSNSRKYLNLKDYFKKQFRFDCLEWKNDSDISQLLDEAENKLKSENKIILVGDSTGANFAYQLRERLKEKGKNSVLIITSPLLNIDNRIADFEFPENIIPQLWKIENPENALIIASRKDKVLNQKPLFEKSLNTIELIEADDTHRLEEFHHFLSEIEKYIHSKL